MWSIPWTSQAQVTDRIRVNTDMLQRHHLVFGAIARRMPDRAISGSRPQMRESLRRPWRGQLLLYVILCPAGSRENLREGLNSSPPAGQGGTTLHPC